ncbi:Cof-type HAD-IIB family hydrolase [Clostridium botulinum]|uniref:Haloacid dehalogenase n=3 Tax=Clostridium botulinum TaxID=1491 RepID=A0A9Q1ZCL3_CLOBO|nr:Cof-type HAD-IIB family hydrolase [Clostridium botulinum]AEB75202.1 Cof family protein, putative [Clostridium botulinum BKT015925]KEI03341.1 haloacid dehalogenase [Clostridium botulinum D str. 16868]KEI05417.1 haloacid dehalogenase [Clostridium botulinum C/D str. Sp77]KLU75176.1 haloacid dehalogenase [Clostridium botulinum V891]KOA73347.1 haloacid dehalogenase [Clostridium botulinum]
MYKLIGIDIDGTLVKNNKTLSNKTIETIEKAKKKGIKIVLVTGRPIQGLKQYTEKLGLDSDNDYGIACSGGFIQCLGNKKVIFESSLTFKEFNYLYNLTKTLNITLNFLSRDTILTPNLNLTTQVECFLSNMSMKITDFETLDENTFINRIVYINETDDFADHLIKIIKRANIKYTFPEKLHGNSNLILDEDTLPKELFENFTVLKPSSETLEIQKKGINKGSSLNFLAKKLGINPNEVIAVGDSGNDIDMIKYAGLGVAMGNAFSEVKEIADYITYTNEEDGLAHVIEKFILNI